MPVCCINKLFCLELTASLGNFCVDSIGCKRTATGNTMTNPVCTVDTCSCPSNYYGLNGQCIIGMIIFFLSFMLSF